MTVYDWVPIPREVKKPESVPGYNWRRFKLKSHDEKICSPNQNIYLYYMPILTTISLRHLVLGHSTGRCLLTTDTATIRYRRERRFRRWRIWRIIVTFRRRMRVASIRRKCCCRSAHSDCLAIPTCRSEIQKNWIVRQKNWRYFSTDPYVGCL